MSLHHFGATEVVSESADEARLRTRVILSSTREGAAAPLTYCTYLDVVRQTPAGWRFAERVLHFDSAVVAARSASTS